MVPKDTSKDFSASESMMRAETHNSQRATLCIFFDPSMTTSTCQQKIAENTCWKAGRSTETLVRNKAKLLTTLENGCQSSS